MGNQKLKWREIIAYGMGDLGGNLAWTTISAFVMVYYTDNVGLSSAVAGTFMLLSRLLDGLSDIIFGAIMDRTRTKWGKARPWIMISAPLSALGLILVFNVPDSWSTTAKTIYAFLTYTYMAAIAYTMVSLSLSALMSLITDDRKSRERASISRLVFGVVSGSAASVVGTLLSSYLGWGKTSVLLAIVSVICLYITAFGTRERVEQPQKANHEKRPVWEDFVLLCKNKFFIPITILFLVNFAATGLTQGAGLYYARDVLGNENLYGALSMVGLPSMFIGFAVFTMLASKFGQYRVMLAGLLLQIISAAIIMFAGANVAVVFTATFARNFGMALLSSGIYPLVAETVDYGEWKNGVRQDGLTNSAVSFGTKVGTGLGTALLGFLLEAGHYSANATVQSTETIWMIKFLYAGSTVVFLVIGIICMIFLNIEKIYSVIEKELRERRGEMNGNADR